MRAIFIAKISKYKRQFPSCFSIAWPTIFDGKRGQKSTLCVASGAFTRLFEMMNEISSFLSKKNDIILNKNVVFQKNEYLILCYGVKEELIIYFWGIFQFITSGWAETIFRWVGNSKWKFFCYGKNRENFEVFTI